MTISYCVSATMEDFTLHEFVMVEKHYYLLPIIWDNTGLQQSSEVG